MDTVTRVGPTRAGAAGTAAAAVGCRGVPGAVGSAEHACAVPGYLQLPDLAMSWQCIDCGEFWHVIPARRRPGSPLEFDWVRDPNGRDGLDEMEHTIHARRS
jgi:hypothetical protein